MIESVKWAYVLVYRGGSGRMVNGKMGGMWSGDMKKNIGFGATESQVTISFDSRSTVAANSIPAKDVPQWIAQSTIDGTETVDSSYLVCYFLLL